MPFSSPEMRFSCIACRIACSSSRMRFGGRCAMLSKSRQETGGSMSVISGLPGAPMFRLLSVICSTSLKQAANFDVAAPSAIILVDATDQSRRGAPRPLAGGQSERFIKSVSCSGLMLSHPPLPIGALDPKRTGHAVGTMSDVDRVRTGSFRAGSVKGRHPVAT